MRQPAHRKAKLLARRRKRDVEQCSVEQHGLVETECPKTRANSTCLFSRQPGSFRSTGYAHPLPPAAQPDRLAPANSGGHDGGRGLDQAGPSEDRGMQQMRSKLLSNEQPRTMRTEPDSEGKPSPRKAKGVAKGTGKKLDQNGSKERRRDSGPKSTQRGEAQQRPSRRPARGH